MPHVWVVTLVHFSSEPFMYNHVDCSLYANKGLVLSNATSNIPVYNTSRPSKSSDDLIKNIGTHTTQSTSGHISLFAVLKPDVR